MALSVTSSNPTWFSIYGPSLGADPLPLTDKTRVIYIEDHYDPAVLASLLTRSDVTVITRFFHHAPQTGSFVTLNYPLWLHRVARNFNTLSLKDQFETESCFNFMIYKRRELRLQCLRAIEKFGLHTEHYTANVMPNEFRHEPRVFGNTKATAYNFIKDYTEHLSHNVFDHTAVSLITETIEPAWQDQMAYTEKSLYPVLSCTFPIWLGGRLQSQGWQQLGFDAFDDVIDHSYQDASTSQQRIELAIERNLDILTDLDLARKLRKQHMPRLLANRHLLLRQAVRPYLDRVKHSFPSHIQTIIKEIESS